MSKPVLAPRRDWGSDETGATILHVDMDAFFASVELARRPALRGLPVIVGGGHRGVVLAATYPARTFGVRSGMPMGQALRSCPHAVVVEPDHRAYRSVSEQVMGVLRDVTAIVEQVSVDEAFLDVSGAVRRLGPPTMIAEQIRAQVRSSLGITCSVGIATTKFVAKLGSAHAKPDGVLLVPASATQDFLRSLPVGALWGVGEKTETQLARWGVRTVAELADLDLEMVQQMVGRAHGAHLHDLAHGRDPRPVVPGREEEKSIGSETTFPQDVSAMGVIDDKVRELADSCAVRLRKTGLCGRTVTVKVRTPDFRTMTRSRTLDTPTDVGREIFLVARELAAGLVLGPVRLIGVRVDGLVPVDRVVHQPTFDDVLAASSRTTSPTGPEPGSSDRRRAERAMDAVRERFGSTAIVAGTGRTTGKL